MLSKINGKHIYSRKDTGDMFITAQQIRQYRSNNWVWLCFNLIDGKILAVPEDDLLRDFIDITEEAKK